eukprot:scaffold3362_cov121-Isochrysis_galbana.AAC.7
MVLTTLRCALGSPPSQFRMRLSAGADILWMLLVWPTQSYVQLHWRQGRPAHRRGSQEQHGAHHT